MKDFDVWYAGAILHTISATSLKQAQNKSKQWAGGTRGTIVVCSSDAPEAEYSKAKAASLVTPTSN
jgi:hypothetical protein